MASDGGRQRRLPRRRPRHRAEMKLTIIEAAFDTKTMPGLFGASSVH
jgi:hypothetical protein